MKIWDSLDELPNNELWAQNDIPLSDISTARQLFTWDKPIEVNGPVFVGVVINFSPSPVDTLVIYQVMSNGGAPASNTAYVRDNGNWKTYNSVHLNGENGAYLFDLLVYDNYVGTDDNHIVKDADGVTILNNPVRSGFVEFKSANNRLEQLEVFGLNGHKVKELYISNSSMNSFDVQGLPSGIYLLRFSSSSESFVKKNMILD